MSGLFFIFQTKMNIQSKLSNVGTSIFTIMSKMARDFGAINLSQGFPDFKSDTVLIDLVSRAMKERYNQYAPMQGDRELRNVLAEKIKLLYGKYYCPATEITITAGATQALFTAIATLIDKGDEAIIFTPAYDCYEPTISLFGGKTIPIQLTSPNYSIDWEEVKRVITNDTKLIIINSPHNPSGSVLLKGDLLALQEIVVNNNLYVISDEVYEHIIFDGITHQSVARYDELSKRSFIVASFGKTFHNTGWKVGYCVAPEYLMKEFQKIHQFNVFSVNHPVQRALATYLKTASHYEALPSFYQQKRDLFLTEMQGSRFDITPSKGTYFQLLDFSAISSKSDIEFAEMVTKEYGVATIPTSVFNKNNEDLKQIRVCFAKKEETLEKVSRILRNL